MRAMTNVREIPKDAGVSTSSIDGQLQAEMTSRRLQGAETRGEDRHDEQ